MYISSRQGYKPPVKSTGRGKKYSHFASLKYCNGAETFYTYDDRRRLSNLAVNSGNKTIMDNDYTFDAVSNVLSVANNASLPASGNAGGRMSHAYTYDGLYRLVSATGTYTGADSKSASYTLAMGYDNMHRIKSKSQHLTQDNVQFNGTLNVGYDLSYTYGTEAGKKFQLASVKDVNYRTEETPGDNNIENNHVYLYDKNGNLVYVNTGRMMKDGHNEVGTRERKLIWDEENRLLAVDDNGFVSNYWYDADGERTVKTSGESDQVYVNGVFSGGSTNTAKFSLYVSPYLVANQGGRYTKHIYAGSQRIVSKVGDFASYDSDPRRIEYAGANTDGLSVNYKAKYAAQQQVIKDNYKTFDVPYNGTDNDNYADGEGFCCNDGYMEAAMARARKAQARAVAKSFKDPDNYENLQFFYHPDHLGSSSFITNLEGEVVQHIEYVPFGEVFIEERNNIWNTPYLFNAKEFDEETGLYYYGARYYDPRVSLWISTDILEEKNYGNSSYAYTYNPITFIDPIGTDTINISYVNKKWKIDAPIIADGNDVFNVANGDKKETYEFSQGEHGKRVNLLNLEIGETKDSYTLGVYHISGEADNGTGFYVAPGGEPSTKNGSGRRIPDGTYPIINPTAGSQWIKPGVGGNVSKRGIRFHYGGTNPRSWTEGCFVLSSGYSVNGNTIHYNADESKTASRNFDNALGAIGHFSYRPKSRTYNREGATFNAPIKHTLILKSRKK